MSHKRGGAIFEQCGAIKDDGSICRGPKKKGFDRCRIHNGELPPRKAKPPKLPKPVKPKSLLPTQASQFKELLAQLPDISLETMRESTQALADVINRLRAGEIPTKQAQVLFMGFREHIKALSMLEKYDPKQIAKREFTAESARELARSTTLAEARDILSHRSNKPLEDLISRGPVTVDVGDASDSLQLIKKELKDSDSETEDEDDA